MAGLIAYCRAGFEKDLANEIQDRATALSVYGFPRLKSNTGFVQFECYQNEDAEGLGKQLLLEKLIFARQMFVYQAHIQDMSTDDRIASIGDVADELPLCGELRVEHADTTEGRELSRFCRKFTVPLRQVMKKRNKLTAKSRSDKPLMMLFFTHTDQAYVGYAEPGNYSPHSSGILRLKFPAEAPSRSTLKLDEAFQMFIPKQEQADRISASAQAVDLGACPGGWTYQLVRRGLFVQAVDNGLMADSLMETGQVRHFPEDGFRFQPKKKNIQWVVCDMIEQPSRVAALMAKWVVDGWCKEAMFNLKLPMKKRHESVYQSLQVIKDAMEKGGVKSYQIQAKHLYHDREEVTVHLRKLK